MGQYILIQLVEPSEFPSRGCKLTRGSRLWATRVPGMTLTLLEPQSRFGDKPLKLQVVRPPKRDCGSKGVNRKRKGGGHRPCTPRQRINHRSTDFRSCRCCSFFFVVVGSEITAAAAVVVHRRYINQTAGRVIAVPALSTVTPYVMTVYSRGSATSTWYLFFLK